MKARIVNVYMEKVSGKNLKIRFFRKPGIPQEPLGNRYIRNLLAMTKFNRNLNCFRISMRTLRSIYRQKNHWDRKSNLRRFPRKMEQTTLNRQERLAYVRTTSLPLDDRFLFYLVLAQEWVAPIGWLIERCWNIKEKKQDFK